MVLKKLSSVLLFLFLICVSCTDSPKKSDKTIDALIQKAHDAMVDLDYLKAIKNAKEAEALALKTNSLEKLPNIYLEWADGLAGVELQKESNAYLGKIVKMDFEQKNKIFQARVYEIYAYNYNELGLASLSVDYTKKAIQLLSGTENAKELLLLRQNYGTLGYHFYSVGNADSSFYYYKKQEAILEQSPIDRNDFVYTKANLYNIKGYLFLEYTKQKDSALHYFKQGYNVRKEHHNNDLASEYLAFGDYYFLEKNYPKALDYYLKAQQNVKEQNTLFNDDNVINRVLADTYEALREPEKQSFYLKKYTSSNDSLKKLHQKTIDGAVSVMMQDKTEETSALKSNYWTLLWGSLGVLLIGMFLVYYYLRQKRRKDLQTKALLVEKDFLLSQKEEETHELKLKVNDSFDDIVTLAKSNDSSFLARFQEAYPTFTEKLLQINPTLVASELKFCALLFFNFTIKDIADYTFTSPKTVQNRKNRIRKRLNIPMEEDINRWIQNLVK